MLHQWRFSWVKDKVHCTFYWEATWYDTCRTNEQDISWVLPCLHRLWLAWVESSCVWDHHNWFCSPSPQCTVTVFLHSWTNSKIGCWNQCFSTIYVHSQLKVHFACRSKIPKYESSELDCHSPNNHYSREKPHLHISILELGKQNCLYLQLHIPSWCCLLCIAEGWNVHHCHRVTSKKCQQIWDTSECT